MLNPGEVAGIAGAGFVAVAGSSVYVVAVTRRRRAFRYQLRDPDPATRIAALAAISERGVYSYLDVLTERALVEPDPDVQDSLARIVSSAEGSPGSDRRLLQLKRWAERVTARSTESVQRSNDERDSADSVGSDAFQPAPSVPPIEPALERMTDAPTDVLRAEDQVGESGHAAVETWLVPDPWADKPIEGTNNGSRPEPDLESVGAREGAGAAKAERSAIELLQEAGYGVERPQHPRRAGPTAPTAPTVPAEPEKADLRQSIQDFLAQRVITVTILEEAVRRMRAENDRLESTFATEMDQPHPLGRTREPSDPLHPG